MIYYYRNIIYGTNVFIRTYQLKNYYNIRANGLLRVTNASIGSNCMKTGCAGMILSRIFNFTRAQLGKSIKYHVLVLLVHKITKFNTKIFKRNFVSGDYIAIGLTNGSVKVFNKSGSVVETYRHLIVQVQSIHFVRELPSKYFPQNTIKISLFIIKY